MADYIGKQHRKHNRKRRAYDDKRHTAALFIAQRAKKRQQEQRKQIVYTHHYAAQFVVQPVCIAQNKGDYAIVHLPKCADGEKCESY